MTLQLALPPLIPIRPCNAGVYHLDACSYVLMHGTRPCVAILVSCGAGPATVAGCIADASGTLTIEAGDAFMLGWSVRDTTWRAVRICGVRIAGPDGLLPDVQLGPVPPDATFLFEDLTGAAAWTSLSTVAAYLAGALPTLTGLQPPVWKGLS